MTFPRRGKVKQFLLLAAIIRKREKVQGMHAHLLFAYDYQVRGGGKGVSNRKRKSRGEGGRGVLLSSSPLLLSWREKGKEERGGPHETISTIIMCSLRLKKSRRGKEGKGGGKGGNDLLHQFARSQKEGKGSWHGVTSGTW